ncbi:hypothetical protein K1T71_006742 [Dendrolimus kikuchii]|uniref:Uncharacterized protein n=1 Tax=Dendrolimus kikuchii TaxID=765133 RepID=A0ACC1D1M9_9NEOP|nr:hypothetical protein K1T71_006742 [Dendrolimus kikuchii]
MAVDNKNAENNKDKTLNINGGDLNGTNVIRNSLKKNTETNIKKADTSNTESWEGLSVFEKTRRMISLITVEPILACYVMPSVLSALATQNLYLEKACRVNLGFDHHICDALTRRETSNYTIEEEAVQTLVASVTGWKTVLQSFLPCGILIFLGAYSDRVGQRKFCMLLPIVGEFLTSIGLIVNTYFFYELPVEAAAVTEAIFPALTGGWFTMFMGVFSYIADVTTEEQRTLRIGIVNLFHSVGVPVGAALSGILVRKIGLYGVFAVSATLYVLSFVYGFIRIKEVKKSNVKSATNCCGWMKDFFDTRYVKETLMVAFKSGPNNRRLRVIMLVVVLCVIIGPIYGEMSVVYLFTRFRFNWNEVDFSMFSTYAMCTSLVGTLFSVGVFSHLLKFDDAIIGVISCTSKILAGFMYAFATKTWQMYIAPLIEIFNGTSFIAMRSMVSKLVEKDELGISIYGIYHKYITIVGRQIIYYLAMLLLHYGGQKQIQGTLDKKNEKEIESRINEAPERGVENKAYEADETDKNNEKSTNTLNQNIPEENNDNVQSQIEMGFTESMLCNSKLQH